MAGGPSLSLIHISTGQEGDHTTLRTPLRLRLLYLDESGAPVTAERTDEAAAPVPGDVTTARAACLSPSLRPSGTGLELTVPVELTVERSRRCTWDAITAAELTEPEPGRRPSLVRCRPKKGESPVSYTHLDVYKRQVPPRAAVNEAVEMTKRHRREKAAGMVNAILRKFAANREDMPPLPKGSPAQTLSLRYSHPRWLVERLLSLIGEEETEAYLRMNNQVCLLYTSRCV